MSDFPFSLVRIHVPTDGTNTKLNFQDVNSDYVENYFERQL